MVDWTKQDEKELAKERNELLKKLKVLTLWNDPLIWRAWEPISMIKLIVIPFYEELSIIKDYGTQICSISILELWIKEFDPSNYLQVGIDAIGATSNLLTYLWMDDESYGSQQQEPLPTCLTKQPWLTTPPSQSISYPWCKNLIFIMIAL